MDDEDGEMYRAVLKAEMSSTQEAMHEELEVKLELGWCLCAN